MTSSYFYILPSLPFLRFGDPPPLSFAQLLAQCDAWLGQGDYSQLEVARIDLAHLAVESVRNATLHRWVVFENSLRNEIAQFRAQRMGLLPETYIRTDLPWDPSVVAHAKETLKRESPLAAEMELLEVRWQFLSDQESGHFFDLDALIIYALKIQILERISQFVPERGMECLGGIIEENLGDER